jgi:hypothetical protein
MKVLVALALLCYAEAGISPKTRLGYSTGGDTSLPLGLNPTGMVSVDLPLDDLPISVRVSGEYEMAHDEMAPKELTIDVDAGSVGPVDISGVVTVGDPLGARELSAEATLAHEYGTVTFDSTEAMPKEVTLRALSKSGVEVRPSWNPRIGAPEGLSFDIDARLQADSDRAVIYATAAPGKRPEVRFHFGLQDGSLDITPLLDEGAKATKFEYVRTGLPDGASARATLQDKSLTLAAQVAVAGGELLPEVTVDLNDVTAAPKLSLKQSFSL